MSGESTLKDSNEQSPNDSTLNKDDIIADLQKQLESVKNKSDELLSETKKAKQKAREEAEAKEQARLERAKKEGDFEQLLKSSEKQRTELHEQLEALRGKVSSEKIKTESLKLAAELADGHNAEILSEFIARRLKYTDDGLKVLDSNGELTVSRIEDLKNEFTNSEKYRSLLRGNKSSGGGAQGSGNSVPTTKQISRHSFDKMEPSAQMKHIKSGGTVVDE